MNEPESLNDKLLFTPGPLTTSRSVKEAMLRDLGSRDAAFIEIVRSIRERLLDIGGVSKEVGFEAILMQGSGTFGIESVISSAVPDNGKLLVLINGAYGRRIETIARRCGVVVTSIEWPENEPIPADEVERALGRATDVTHVAVVHCETTSGVMNPVEEIGGVVRSAERVFIVDAMSSFGGTALDVGRARIDFLVSSSNKCIEGVPGFSFVIARREELLKAEGIALSVSLDLFAQWEGLERNGQFRFTPPTHALLAFNQALKELEEEGGVVARAARYRRNHEILLVGMRELGFQEYVPREHQGWIITTFLYPDDPAFDFNAFYENLSARGMVIYPGKLTELDCFRIGNIGRLDESHMRALLDAIKEVALEMGLR